MPAPKRNRPPFPASIMKAMRRIENMAFAKWARGLLRLHYVEPKADFESLIEKSLADGLQFERATRRDPQQSAYPVTYYMFRAKDGAVLAGIMVTLEQLREALRNPTLTVKAKPINGKRLQLTENSVDQS
jgi:hypothetical protein